MAKTGTRTPRSRYIGGDEVRSFTLGSGVNPRQDERTMNTTRLLATEGLQYETHVEEGSRVQTGGRMDGSKRDLRLKIVGNPGFCDHAIQRQRRPGIFYTLDVHKTLLHDVGLHTGHNIRRRWRTDSVLRFHENM